MRASPTNATKYKKTYLKPAGGNKSVEWSPPPPSLRPEITDIVTWILSDIVPSRSVEGFEYTRL